MPTRRFVVNWDTYVNSVVLKDGIGTDFTATTSGETLSFAPNTENEEYTGTVSLQDGYVIDTVTATNTGGTATVGSITDHTFAVTVQGIAGTITLNITSKQSSSSTLQFKHFFDAGTIGSGTIKFRHYSQTEPSSGAPKVSIKYTDDYVSGYIAYSLDNGATWSDYITTQTTLLTDVTQIKLKSKGLDGGIIIYKGPYGYNGESGVATTTISPAGLDDTRPYETENITITEDTGFYYLCYYD